MYINKILKYYMKFSGGIGGMDLSSPIPPLLLSYNVTWKSCNTLRVCGIPVLVTGVPLLHSSLKKVQAVS